MPQTPTDEAATQLSCSPAGLLTILILAVIPPACMQARLMAIARLYAVAVTRISKHISSYAYTSRTRMGCPIQVWDILYRLRICPGPAWRTRRATHARACWHGLPMP